MSARRLLRTAQSVLRHSDCGTLVARANCAFLAPRSVALRHVSRDREASLLPQ